MGGGVMPYAAGALVALLTARALHGRRPAVLVLASSPRQGAYVACRLRTCSRKVTLLCLPEDGPAGEPMKYPLQGYVDKLCGDAGVQQIGGLEDVAGRRFDHVLLIGRAREVGPGLAALGAHRVRFARALAAYPGIIGAGGAPPEAAGEHVVEGYIPLAVEFAPGDAEGAVEFAVHGVDQPVLLSPGGEEACALLERAGISAQVTGDVYAAKLRKHLMACVAGPLSATAAGGLDFREMLSSHRPRMEDLWQEAVSVLEGPYREAYLGARGLKVSLFQTLEALGFGFPSEWHDLQAGVPMDLAGGILHVQAAGLRLGCPTPATDALLRELGPAGAGGA